MNAQEASRLLPMTVVTKVVSTIDNLMKIKGVVTEIHEDRFYVNWDFGIKESIRFTDAKNIKVY